jgi:hypothetical protein
VSESKRYLDSDGFTWQVCEIPVADTAPFVDASGVEMHRGSLYFLSRLGTRVMSPYPSSWVAMSWHELEGMCRRAAPPAGDVWLSSRFHAADAVADAR